MTLLALLTIETDFLIQIITVAVFVVLGILVLALRKTSFTVQSLSFAAICISLSFALSFAKLWQMPFGGSVSFGRMMPLLIYAYAFGWKRGLLAGFVYSLLESMVGVYYIGIVPYLLDYTIAFTTIGLAGLVRNHKKMPLLLGAIIAALGRFIPQYLSGVLYWGSYMPEEFPIQNVLIYSAWYSSYIFIDAAIAYVMIKLMFLSPEVKKRIELLKKDNSVFSNDIEDEGAAR